MRSFNEKHVIKGCVRNDRRAQERLYRQFFPAMAGMVRRYTSDDDSVLVIVNDGFLKVFKSIGSYEARGSLEGWIRRIVYRSMADFFRKENRYLRFIVLDEEDRHEEARTIDDLYYADLISMVEALPEMKQQVFKMYAIEGYSHREIGEALGISEGTSKWYLSEARRHLRQAIENNMNQSYAG